jgi:5-hydroxyisourate hydrolase-like protein (transthyretin family)
MLNSSGHIACRPNPVIHETVVSYFVAKPTALTIRVFSVTGREMKRIETRADSYGRHEKVVNLSDLKAGEYILEVKTSTFKESVKLIKN